MAESAATRPLEAARGPVAAAVFGAESPATRAYRGRVGARYAGSPVAARMPTLFTRLRRARTRTVSTRGLPPRFENSTSAVDSSQNQPNRRDREFRSSAGTRRRLASAQAARRRARELALRRVPGLGRGVPGAPRAARAARGRRGRAAPPRARRGGRRRGTRVMQLSLRREGAARDCSGARIRASSARREIIARPGMSRNERTLTERGALDVGNVALVSRPGGRVRARGAPARVRARRARLCGIQIFNTTSMCAYATVSTQALRLCFENSTRAIDSSKNQPNRLRFDRAIAVARGPRGVGLGSTKLQNSLSRSNRRRFG